MLKIRSATLKGRGIKDSSDAGGGKAAGGGKVGGKDAGGGTAGGKAGGKDAGGGKVAGWRQSLVAWRQSWRQLSRWRQSSGAKLAVRLPQ
eukprot:gene12300-biopygen871